ncbi:MAG: hypothetical protein P8P74_13685 [Crocinitomicaceae bacterium]|nr:hypothetical protein [Crocinitomicaceae bacterium]
MAALILASLWEYTGPFISKKDLIFDAIMMLIWCNVMYTSGWVGGILRHYYLGSYPLENPGRWVLFIFGTIFTVFVLEIRFSLIVNPMLVG